jgi:hypothetical protein
MACQHNWAFDIEADGIYYNITSSTDQTAEVTKGTNPYSGSISIPNTIEFRGKQLSVTKIGMQAFKDCLELTSIFLSEGIVSIDNEAFSGCKKLESIKLPASLKIIGDMYAFGNCLKLKDIQWSGNIEYIGGYAFYGCESITEVSIPRSVKKTGHAIFGNCQNLKRVFLPKNITELNDMFFKCTGIETIKVEGALPPIVENEYDFFTKDILLNATLYVPKNTSGTYRESKYWKDFFVIEEDEMLGRCYYLNITCGNNGQVDIGDKHISNNNSPMIIGGFEGDKIELIFMPSTSRDKYHVNSFTINDVEMADKIEDNAYSFILTEDKTISVSFIKYYNVIVNSEGDKGSVIFNGDTIHNGSKTFMFDEHVSMTMHVDIKEGYSVNTIPKNNNGGLKKIDDTTFTLERSSDCTISFSYPKIAIQLNCKCEGNGVLYTNDKPFTPKSTTISVGCYYFDNVNLKCVPEKGYHLASLIIDGIDAVNEVVNNEYNFIAKSRNFIKIICTFEEGDFSDRDNSIAANAVSDLIEVISTVEYSEICKNRIDAARSAYEALTEKQKELVTNYKNLTDAEKTYENLKTAAEIDAANAIAANIVSELIDAIATVEYSEVCKNRIDVARSAYDALTEEQKELVTNYDKLKDAEILYKKLEETATDISNAYITIAIKNAKYLMNNKIVIVKNGKKYNAYGQLE